MRYLDAHCDTLVRCYDHGEHLGENPFHLDLKRLSAYGPCGQIFAVWLDDRIYGAPEVGEQAWNYLCKVTAFAKEQQERYPQWLQWCTNVQDWQEAKEQGRCAGILSLEGGHGLGGQLERVEQLYHMGFRIITLTWNDENLLACGCGAKRQGGLKPFGRQVLEKMKELHMLCDVSHLNERGFYEVAETGCRMIATHSDSKQVWDHARGLTDDQYRVLVAQGTGTGLNLCPLFVGRRSGLPQVMRHVDHFLELGGEDHLFLGGDLDGIDSIAGGLHGVEDMGRLYELLCKRYNQSVADKVFYGNLERICLSALSQT